MYLKTYFICDDFSVHVLRYLYYTDYTGCGSLEFSFKIVLSACNLFQSVNKMFVFFNNNKVISKYRYHR